MVSVAIASAPVGAPAVVDHGHHRLRHHRTPANGARSSPNRPLLLATADKRHCPDVGKRETPLLLLMLGTCHQTKHLPVDPS